MEHVFVFVVCGAAEHVDTLDFSVRYLRHFSQNPIWIVTDADRNEKPVSGEHVIDFRTPRHLDNHQASIYLKTSLHQILPQGNLYCYLDSDVIALDARVDDIFKEFVAPIVFAPDHCNVSEFSPTALTCNCFNKYWEANDLLRRLEIAYDKNQQINRPAEQDALALELKRMKEDKWVKLKATVQYHLPGQKFQTAGFVYDKKEKVWIDQEGKPVLYNIDVAAVKQRIQAETGYKWDAAHNRWLDAEGNVMQPTCAHLQERIRQDFSINVANNTWQHWNGGVFLFDDGSAAFMEAWHQKCLKIFEMPHWRTRDQGALIATAWEFGLENHPTLAREWNFLADKNNDNLSFDAATGTFSDDGFRSAHQPHLLHIYHDFGKKGWPVWDWVEQLLGR